MTIKEFAEAMVVKVSRLQPNKNLQVQTLGDLVKSYIDPEAKVSPGVSKEILEDLREYVQAFLIKSLNSSPANQGAQQVKPQPKDAQSLLSSVCTELSLARTRYYLSIIEPIYGHTANPNVVWDVYDACTEGQDLAESISKGTETWAKKGLTQVELALKRNNTPMTPEQRVSTWQRILADARRSH